ncbi:Thioredoxin [Holotrichia oblita]|nr:Thioredoxin [Holotrichia oblita]
MTKLKFINSDIDLHPQYEPLDPLLYDVIICPFCGYSAISAFFNKISEKQIPLIRMGVTSKFKSRTFKKVITYQDAIEKYKLALITAMVISAKKGEIGAICNKIAWLSRLSDNDKLYKEFAEKAVSNFELAYQQEDFPIAQMDESALGGIKMKIKNLDNTTFFETINSQTKPVIVDFYADWCVLCKMIAPLLEELATEHENDVAFYKVNVDENPDIAAKYSVMNIPTFASFKGGQHQRIKAGQSPAFVRFGGGSLDRQKKKKITTIAGFLIIIIGVVTVVSIILYTYINREKEYFVFSKKNLATRLYNEVMNYDFENDYPESASEVMEFNNKITLLIYGKMLLDNELLPGLLEKQRMLYSESLLSSITYDEQYENLVKGLEVYNQNKTICYDINQESPQNIPDHENMVSINTIWQTSNMGKVMWMYTLEENDAGQYKILRYEVVG